MTAEEQAQTRQWAQSRATLVRELKEKLLKLGLKTSGKKEDLAKRLATDGRLDKQEAATKEREARLITGEHLDKLKSYLYGIAGKAAKLMHPYSTNVLESMNSLKAGLAGKHWRRIGTHSARADLALLHLICFIMRRSRSTSSSSSLKSVACPRLTFLIPAMHTARNQCTNRSETAKSGKIVGGSVQRRTGR